TVENYRRMERTLNETLIAVQRIAEESRETSLREAEILRKEGEMEARRALERAEVEARSMQDAIRELRAERDTLFMKLRNLMEEELLRLHALRSAYADGSAPERGQAGSSAAEPASAPSAVSAAELAAAYENGDPAAASRPPGERRSPLPVPGGAHDLLHRPVGLPEGGKPTATREAIRPGPRELGSW
ncbi:MAG: DivIVA domain-containing protein, partial [Gemmatimonadetes bacterium]|nr:DivIVA domain-containing protein [Gemmatimonadota bacterium]